MSFWIIQVELLENYKTYIKFIERHTLCWDNGVDFAPEYLYEQIKEKVA